MRAKGTLDYHKAHPNRFAGRISRDRLVVTLDPDMFEVFTTPEAVNAVLGALIATMPGARKPQTTRQPSRPERDVD